MNGYGIVILETKKSGQIYLNRHICPGFLLFAGKNAQEVLRFIMSPYKKDKIENIVLTFF